MGESWTEGTLGQIATPRSGQSIQARSQLLEQPFQNHPTFIPPGEGWDTVNEWFVARKIPDALNTRRTAIFVSTVSFPASPYWLAEYNEDEGWHSVPVDPCTCPRNGLKQALWHPENSPPTWDDIRLTITGSGNLDATTFDLLLSTTNGNCAPEYYVGDEIFEKQVRLYDFRSDAGSYLNGTHILERATSYPYPMGRLNHMPKETTWWKQFGGWSMQVEEHWEWVGGPGVDTTPPSPDRTHTVTGFFVMFLRGSIFEQTEVGSGENFDDESVIEVVAFYTEEPDWLQDYVDPCEANVVSSSSSSQTSGSSNSSLSSSSTSLTSQSSSGDSSGESFESDSSESQVSESSASESSEDSSNSSEPAIPDRGMFSLTGWGATLSVVSPVSLQRLGVVGPNLIAVPTGAITSWATIEPANARTLLGVNFKLTV